MAAVAAATVVAAVATAAVAAAVVVATVGDVAMAAETSGAAAKHSAFVSSSASAYLILAGCDR
jgi:hypothetical protein